MKPPAEKITWNRARTGQDRSDQTKTQQKLNANGDGQPLLWLQCCQPASRPPIARALNAHFDCGHQVGPPRLAVLTLTVCDELNPAQVERCRSKQGE